MNKFLKYFFIISILLITPSIIKAEEILSETTKYYKTTILKNPLQSANNQTYYYSETIEVTEEEYNNSDQLAINSVTVETNYKKLTVSISKYNNTFYRYKAVLNWKQMPSTRSYDVIGIGHYSNVEVAGNVDFEQYYCYSGGSCFTNTVYYQKIISTGAGAMFALPSGSINTLKQTIILMMQKRDPSSTITSQIASGDYAHATSTISYNNAKNFTVSQYGIDVGVNINYYDNMPYGAATWSGTW